jgi:hypothetical protein
MALPTAIASDGERVWVAGDNLETSLPSFDISIFRAKDGQPLGFLKAEKARSRSLGGSIKALTWDGKTLWSAVAAGFSSSISEIDPNSGKVLRSFFANCDPRGVAISGDHVWTLCDNGAGRASIDGRIMGKDEASFQSSRQFIADTVGEPVSLVKREGSFFLLALADRSIHRLTPKPSEERSGGSLNSGQVGAAGGPTGLYQRRSPECNASTDGSKFALLVSADIAKRDNQPYNSDFWYDLVDQYKTLMDLGFQERNIYVLYGSGVDFWSTRLEFNAVIQFGHEITFAGLTRKNFEFVLGGIDGQMHDNETLYIWWFGHGILTGGPDEVAFPTPDTGVSSVDFENYLGQLTHSTFFVASTCHSGCLLDRPGIVNQKNVFTLATAQCEKEAFEAPAACGVSDTSEANAWLARSMQARHRWDPLSVCERISLAGIYQILRDNMQTSTPLISDDCRAGSIFLNLCAP